MLSTQALVGLLVLGLGGAADTTQAGAGRLCIAAAQPPDKIAGQANEAGFSIQIDAHPEVVLDHERSIQHPGLDIGARHLVRVRRDGKVVESFHFKYTKQSTESLCLFFEPYYAVWQLWPTKNARHICKCTP